MNTTFLCWITDLDECKVRKHNCSKQSYCRNSPGTFNCLCPKGYEGDGVTKCNPTKTTRFTTPKYLLKDLARGAWDSILVALSAGVIGLALLVIIILMLKKMCVKCCKCGKEKEIAYQGKWIKCRPAKGRFSRSWTYVNSPLQVILHFPVWRPGRLAPLWILKCLDAGKGAERPFGRAVIVARTEETLHRTD